MPCLQTCDCQCTLVNVDPAGSNIFINANPGGLGLNGCHCDLSGNDGAGTSVAMWVSDTVMFISVTTGGVEYHGICEGAGVCDAEGNFDCGGTVTLYDVNGNTLTVVVDGRSCTTCLPSGDPEMVLTISDTSPTDANLPKTWCGITWEKSIANGGPADPLGANQRRDGDSATVCPTFYTKGKSLILFFPPSPNPRGYFARHRWQFNDELDMNRYYKITGFSTYLISASAANTLQLLTTLTDQKQFINANPPPLNRPPAWTAGFTAYSDLNKILGVGAPTYNDYALTTAFFTNHSTGGLVYTWTQGGGW